VTVSTGHFLVAGHESISRLDVVKRRGVKPNRVEVTTLMVWVTSCALQLLEQPVIPTIDLDAGFERLVAIKAKCTFYPSLAESMTGCAVR
jgi:hypothetical protein